MSLFLNNKDRILAIVPHKCGYSSFRRSASYLKLDLLNWRVYLRYRFSDYRIVQIVREPSARIVSCFKDKFRLMPTWVGSDSFRWAYLHRVVFNHCGFDFDASDEAIARTCRDFSFDQFVRILPEIFTCDPHIRPQSSFGVFTPHQQIQLKFPQREVIRIEEIANAGLPNFDHQKKYHSTDKITEEIRPNREQLAIIESLYAADFELGNYTPPNNGT